MKKLLQVHIVITISCECLHKLGGVTLIQLMMQVSYISVAF
jgi:hypothetical protein